MWWFKPWHWMLAFESSEIITDPKALFDMYNSLAPVGVAENRFSYQVGLRGNIVGWVLMKKRRDASSTRRFLKKSPAFLFTSEGRLNPECVDSIKWGLK